MAADNQRGALFRSPAPHQHSRVTYAELFFDLVFVFAVTQISHTLLSRLTPLGHLPMRGDAARSGPRRARGCEHAYRRRQMRRHSGVPRGWTRSHSSRSGS